jgi:hypothetical protein
VSKRPEIERVTVAEALRRLTEWHDSHARLMTLTPSYLGEFGDAERRYDEATESLRRCRV